MKLSTKKNTLSYIWRQNELFQRVRTEFRNKLLKVLFSFRFNGDGDLKLKR